MSVKEQSIGAMDISSEIGAKVLSAMDQICGDIPSDHQAVITLRALEHYRDEMEAGLRGALIKYYRAADQVERFRRA